MNTYVMVRAAYKDAAMSEYRLKLAKLTAAVSLANQTSRDFITVLRLDREDPLVSERVRLFHKVSPQLLLVWSMGELKTSTFEDGWHLVTRLDDDDVISNYYIAEVQQRAAQQQKEQVWIYPNGYMYFQEQLRPVFSPYNQFITLQTNRRVTPFDFKHLQVTNHYPLSNISNERHWVWLRHGANKSPLRLRLWRKTPGDINQKPQFSQDWSEVDRFVRNTEQLNDNSEEIHDHKKSRDVEVFKERFRRKT